jgi:hypothetical protein
VKKSVIIPEATVEVETKFYATSFSSVHDSYRNQSPAFDTYEETMQWIAQDLSTSTNPRTYEIKALHGRFAENVG